LDAKAVFQVDGYFMLSLGKTVQDPRIHFPYILILSAICVINESIHRVTRSVVLTSWFSFAKHS